jgi:hypothetical protein
MWISDFGFLGALLEYPKNPKSTISDMDFGILGALLHDPPFRNPQSTIRNRKSFRFDENKVRRLIINDQNAKTFRMLAINFLERR